MPALQNKPAAHLRTRLDRLHNIPSHRTTSTTRPTGPRNTGNHSMVEVKQQKQNNALDTKSAHCQYHYLQFTFFKLSCPDPQSGPRIHAKLVHLVELAYRTRKGEQFGQAQHCSCCEQALGKGNEIFRPFSRGRKMRNIASAANTSDLMWRNRFISGADHRVGLMFFL